MSFSAFVGIDWSGARGPWQSGLRIAIAFPGREPPRLLTGPGHKGRWSRDTIVAWIGDECDRGRVLVGLDFAFGFPAFDGLEQSPAQELWAELDAFCATEGNCYGGRFFADPAHRFGEHIFSRQRKGSLFQPSHRRSTEQVAALLKGASPSPVLLAIGAAQVGPSSISGMRALHKLSTREGRRPVIWPFSDDDGVSTVVAEVFPRYFPLSRGCKAKMSDHALLNNALAAFESLPIAEAPKSEDEGDALITAAALRALGTVSPSASLPSSSGREGWILGVPAQALIP